VSELDLGQKLDMRRAFWAAGSSTRLDVKLGAFIDPARSRARARAEDWTDLDVLGVSYGPVSGAQFVVADCKTAKGRVTERVFWLRGVADLFGAQAAFLTRDSEIPEAARQLGVRLRIATFDARDRAAFLEQLGDAQLPATGSFLEQDAVVRWTRLTLELPEAAARLQSYRQTFYWLLRPGRNLTALPTTLRGAAKAFNPEQRWARAILVDLAWLYLVALLAALDEVTRLHLAEPQVGLTQAMVGSEQERREKEQLGKLLAELFTQIDPGVGRKLPRVPVLPDYFDDLLDLATRLSRRRNEVNGALRALEFTGVETIANAGARWPEAFPGRNEREVKLASDVVRFLVRAARLPADFVPLFDEAASGGSAGQAVRGEPSGGPLVPDEPRHGAGQVANAKKGRRVIAREDGLFDQEIGAADDA
jgi:hypothetical protein